MTPLLKTRSFKEHSFLRKCHILWVKAHMTQGRARLSPIGKCSIKSTDLFNVSWNHNKRHEVFDVTMKVAPKNGLQYMSTKLLNQGSF